MLTLIKKRFHTEALDFMGAARFRRDVERQTRRWDNEWLSYWVSERDYAYKYFVAMRSIEDEQRKAHLEKIYSLSAHDFFHYKPTDLYAFAVWAEGEWIAGARICELGCGPGLLGKVIAPYCKEYIGLDYSRLALHVAGLVSPASCRYLHLSEITQLRSLEASCDLCAGRYFFIHQNWESASWILRLFRHLLRRGGRISADFFARGDSDSVYGDSWLIRDPEEELSEDHPSCVFDYSEDHAARLAAQHDLALESVEYRPELQRRFAIFRKE
jgi:hypothetical protein